MPRIIASREELRALVGQDLGCSPWVTVTQQDVNQFGQATLDEQWIHCDVERAKAESPYGGTIAHGFFTLSLIPYFLESTFTVQGIKIAVNYGLNRVRFPSAVPVGSRVRMNSHLLECKDILAGVQITCKLTFEVEGATRPACVAEMLMRLYFEDVAAPTGRSSAAGEE